MIKEVNYILAENYQKYKVFAILLFTDNHPYVIKMLKDIDFRNALDRISGDNLPIITTTVFTNSIKTSSSTSFYHILSLLRTPNENIEILDWFDIHSEKDLPQLVLFGEYKKKLYYFKYKIDCKSVDDCFSSIKEPILKCVSLLEKYESKAIRKTELYEKLNFAIKSIQAKNIVKKIFNWASSIRGATGI